jgi:hypothetical protein
MVINSPADATEMEILRERLRRLHITQASIARALDPPVTRNAVCLALNEKIVSRRIVAKAREMAEQAERAPGR